MGKINKKVPNLTTNLSLLINQNFLRVKTLDVPFLHFSLQEIEKTILKHENYFIRGFHCITYKWQIGPNSSVSHLIHYIYICINKLAL